jgi:hypothetical protein
MIRFILALTLLGAPVAAQTTDAEKLQTACIGWQTDRLMIAVVTQKNREMIGALDAIDTSNPSKPLARAVSDGLTQINAAMDKGHSSTGDVMRNVCVSP